MRKLHAVCSWLLAAFGAGYVVLTLAAYGVRASLEIVWLGSTGLVLVLAAFLNLAALAAPAGRAVWLCRAGNLLVLAISVAAVLALPEPQNWLTLGLVAALTLLSWAALRPERR